MRWIKWIGHPVLLTCFFLLLLIEGEHFGGPYLLYLLLALPHGALYALTALAAIGLIITGFSIKKAIIAVALNLSGIYLMAQSLFLFFATDYKTGVNSTFDLAIPSLTFIIFGLSLLSFLIRSIFMFLKSYSEQT